MSNKVWLISGKYVLSEDLVEVMLRDRPYAANIIKQIRCPKQKQIATYTLLSIPADKQRGGNTHYFEEIFNDLTFGLFE